MHVVLRVSTCVHICARMYVHMCVCMHVCIGMCVHACLHVFACVHRYACICMCVRAHRCVCVFLWARSLEAGGGAGAFSLLGPQLPPRSPLVRTRRAAGPTWSGSSLERPRRSLRRRLRADASPTAPPAPARDLQPQPPPAGGASPRILSLSPVRACAVSLWARTKAMRVFG